MLKDFQREAMVSEEDKKKTVILNQEAFLRQFRKIGSMHGALRKMGFGAGITRKTVNQWISQDIYGFSEKYTEAVENFREYLQDIAVKKVVEGQPFNHMAWLGLMNALWPEKYKRSATEPENTTAKELMQKMKKWGSREAEAKKASVKIVDTSDDEKERAVEEARKIMVNKSNGNSNDRNKK